MYFRRGIDYQKVLAEDPIIICIWFIFIRNIIAKYGIFESDIYNFDETGFLIGILLYVKVIITFNRYGKLYTK